jgi:hypothetical protein
LRGDLSSNAGAWEGVEIYSRPVGGSANWDMS